MTHLRRFMVGFSVLGTLASFMYILVATPFGPQFLITLAAAGLSYFIGFLIFGDE